MHPYLEVPVEGVPNSLRGNPSLTLHTNKRMYVTYGPGTPDYALSIDSGTPLTGSSICCWFRYNGSSLRGSSNTGYYYITCHDGNGTNQYVRYLLVLIAPEYGTHVGRVSGVMHTYAGVYGSQIDVLSAYVNDTIFDGNWHHLAMSNTMKNGKLNGVDVTLYLDGEIVMTKAVSSINNTYSSYQWYNRSLGEETYGPGNPTPNYWNRQFDIADWAGFQGALNQHHVRLMYSGVAARNAVEHPMAYGAGAVIGRPRCVWNWYDFAEATPQIYDRDQTWVTLSDSHVMVAPTTRRIFIPESEASGSTYDENIADEATVGDSLNSELTADESMADTMSVSDSQANTAIMQEDMESTLVPVEAMTPSGDERIDLSETLVAVESLTNQADFTVPIGDTLTLSGGARTDFIYLLSTVLEWSDALNQIINPVIGNTLTAAEVMSVTYPRNLTDILTVSEAMTPGPNIFSLSPVSTINMADYLTGWNGKPAYCDGFASETFEYATV